MVNNTDCGTQVYVVSVELMVLLSVVDSVVVSVGDSDILGCQTHSLRACICPVWMIWTFKLRKKDFTTYKNRF